MARLLVISADLLQRTKLSDALSLGGHDVQVCADLEAALGSDNPTPEGVLLNPILPGLPSEDSLRQAARRFPSASLFLIRSEGVSAKLLHSCDDYVDPNAEPEFILHRIDRALELSEYLCRPLEPAEFRDWSLFLLPKSRFITLAKWELSRGRRYGGRAVLVRTAIDFFGKVRDLAGHKAADDLRQSLGQILMTSLRASDLVAPWGDDGFAILIPEASREGAFGFLRKVGGVVQDAVRSHPEWQEQSASFGLCFMPVDPQVTAEEWVDWAGRALRSSQRDGNGQMREVIFQLGEGQVVEFVPGSAETT